MAIDQQPMPSDATVVANEQKRAAWPTSTVARRLAYSEDAVRRMCESGKLVGAYRSGPGGHWRIPETAIESFFEATRPLRRKRR